MLFNKFNKKKKEKKIGTAYLKSMLQRKRFGPSEKKSEFTIQFNKIRNKI